MQINRVHFIWLGLALAIGVLVYFSDQANFPLTICSYTVAFALYLFIYLGRNDLPLKKFEQLALLTFLVPLFSVPTLSPDFYRFLWDGELTTYGVHPYAYTPNEIVNGSIIQLNPYMEYLYENITSLSKKHYSPYPTINQVYFILPAWISNNVIISLMIMRSMIILTLILGYIYFKKLLKISSISPAQSIVLLFNPFFIIEVMDNLHFEGVMMAWLIIGFYFLHQQKWLKGSFFWGMAVSVKLTPLILLPALLRFFKLKKTIILYSLILFFSVGLTMLMLWPIYAENVLRSIRLYFSNFEFNASVLEFTKWIVDPFTKFSPTPIAGPITVLVGTLFIFIVSWWKPIHSWRQLFSRFMWLYVVYLIFATTVHPWYIILPLVFSVFARNKGVLVWSFLIMLSYGFYHWDSKWISESLVITEYVGLALALLFGDRLNNYLIKYTARFNA